MKSKYSDQFKIEATFVAVMLLIAGMLSIR